MGSVILNLRQDAGARDAIHHAVEAIASGRLVILPTETVYGIAANALDESAVARMVEILDSSLQTPLAFCVKSAVDAMDYAPDMSPLARRLARRAWPGPLTLVLPGPHPDSVIQRVSAPIRRLLEHPLGIALRVPNHPVVEQIRRLAAGPIILARAAINDREDCITGEDAVRHFGESVPLILDAGQSRFARPSTIARIVGDRMDVLRHGVFDLNELRQMSQINVLLVCTGNTCRSPMAEGLLKKKLGERFKCAPTQIENFGFHIASAGIAAMPGGEPSLEAVDVMHASGIDLSSHRSQALNDRMVNEADLILTMTASHRQMVLAQWPTVANRLFVMGRDEGDVFDPIGMPMEYYEACAQQIDHHLNWWLKENPLFNKPDQERNVG